MGTVNHDRKVERLSCRDLKLCFAIANLNVNEDGDHCMVPIICRGIYQNADCVQWSVRQDWLASCRQNLAAMKHCCITACLAMRLESEV
jgi:hypothetical protein